MLVTVSADMILSEFKQHLLMEGCYLGYYPLHEEGNPIEYYLKRRIPNLYYYKYGSLSQLVSSLNVKMKNGDILQLKDAPRMSIGPSFNNIIIGSKDAIGTIKLATFKLLSIPEKILIGIISVKSKDQAKKFIRYLIGEFIEPLYFRYCDLDTVSTMTNNLKLKNSSTEHVLFCLAGIEEITMVHKEMIEEWCLANKVNSKWFHKRDERKISQAHVYEAESLKDIKEQYRSFLWPSSEPTEQLKCEKSFYQHYEPLYIAT